MTDSPDDGTDRRGFLSQASSWLMLGGLASGYGACGAIGLRYLFPARRGSTAWLFVGRADEIEVGDALEYRAPSGQNVTIARQANSGTVDDFVALSSTCPHLGCRVHWESQNTRFFCPCHNGVFDAAGNPVSGPPAEAGQALPRFSMKIEAGILFIEVPVEALT